MNDALINELCDQYRTGLLDDTIPWWQTRFIDEDNGGYLTYRDRDGTLLSTDKPVWVLGRIIWIWSRLYNTVDQREEWLETARHGVEFMTKHAFDTDGRMFFLVTKDGQPLRKRRYLFSETFGAIALAEYARATGSDATLQRARELYNLILKYDRTPGLLPPKVNPETRAMKGHGIRMILLAISQVFREIDPDNPVYNDTIDQAMADVFNDFMKPDKKCLLETVLADGSILDTPDGRTFLPGHAIETSWFLMHEARHRGDSAILEEALQILEWSLDAGWDEEHGGIVYYVDCDGHPAEPYEHELKLWWVHTETLYACLLAYHLTHDVKWYRWYARVHEWSFNHFPDKEYGEWFGYLRRDGTVSNRVKGNIWKGPFHLPRAQLYCWKLLEEMKSGRDA
jgi:N-acylglucosamine 2-epimerase